MEKKKDFLKCLENERSATKKNIYENLLKKSGSIAREFIVTLERINELNYLNANVEVKYSFKGWPGIFHHFIFEKGKKQSPIENIHQRNSVIAYNEEVV